MPIMSICSNPEVLEVMRIINMVVLIIKISVPILLILTGIITLFKTIKVGSDDLFSKAKKSLINKCIAAIVIFLIPTLVNIVVKVSNVNNQYRECLNADISMIDNGYISRAENMVKKALESKTYDDYYTAKYAVSKVKDKNKRDELNKQLDDLYKTIRDEIDKANKNDDKIIDTGVSTGLGKDIVPTEELIEACKWVLNDEKVMIRLQTCEDEKFRYKNPDIELPGGAVEWKNGMYKAKEAITLYQYQRGVFYGEESVQNAEQARNAWVLIYKTVLIHNTVWRKIRWKTTFDTGLGEINYPAGSCSQNYKGHVQRNVEPQYKETIDSAVNTTRYLLIVNPDGKTADVRYNSHSGIEPLIEKSGKQGINFIDIIEKTIKTDHDLASHYRNTRVYDCRNLASENN